MDGWMDGFSLVFNTTDKGLRQSCSPINVSPVVRSRTYVYSCTGTYTFDNHAQNRMPSKLYRRVDMHAPDSNVTWRTCFDVDLPNESIHSSCRLSCWALALTTHTW
jgi:hypothetical protein